MRYAANILVYAGLALWIGGLVIFGAVVAPVLFGGALPRTLAGAINASILSRLGIVEIVAGVILVGGLLYGAIRVGSWMNWANVVLAIAMLATATYYTTMLFPSVNRLRIEIGSFESIASEKQPLKTEFDRGHRLYSTLAKGVLFSAVAILVLHTVSLVRHGARREVSSATAREPVRAVVPGVGTDTRVGDEKKVERTRPSAARL